MIQTIMKKVSLVISLRLSVTQTEKNPSAEGNKNNCLVYFYFLFDLDSKTTSLAQIETDRILPLEQLTRLGAWLELITDKKVTYRKYIKQHFIVFVIIL